MATILDQVRSVRGWTQGQLAEHLGYSQSWVSKVLRGRQSLTVDQIRDLARQVGIPQYLLRIGDSGGEDPTKRRDFSKIAFLAAMPVAPSISYRSADETTASSSPRSPAPSAGWRPRPPPVNSPAARSPTSSSPNGPSPGRRRRRSRWRSARPSARPPGSPPGYTPTCRTSAPPACSTGSRSTRPGGPNIRCWRPTCWAAWPPSRSTTTTRFSGCRWSPRPGRRPAATRRPPRGRGWPASRRSATPPNATSWPRSTACATRRSPSPRANARRPRPGRGSSPSIPASWPDIARW